MDDSTPFSQLSDAELFEWFQSNKQSLLPEETKRHLEDYDRDILR